MTVQAALNWICEHQDEERAEDPIPESTLRALYGRRNRRRLPDARPELVAQLVEMGYSEEQARDSHKCNSYLNTDFSQGKRCDGQGIIWNVPFPTFTDPKTEESTKQ